MAIRPEDQYPGQSTASDADYPHGSARNVSSPGDGTGTPFEQHWLNDVWGFLQSLLSRAGVTPSGNPDTAQASDYHDAFDKVSGGGVLNVDVAGNGAIDLTGVYARTIRLYGARTADGVATFDNRVATYNVLNDTTGGFEIEGRRDGDSTGVILPGQKTIQVWTAPGPSGLRLFGGAVGFLDGNTRAVISSTIDTGGVANDDSRAVIASISNSRASGVTSAVIACSGGEATGGSTAVIACSGEFNRAGGNGRSIVTASRNSETQADRAAVIASRETKNETDNSIAMGFTSVIGDNPPTTANQTLRFEAETGTIYAQSTTIQGIDYAELFQNGEATEIEPGVLVTLDGDSVRRAKPGEDVAGVVSHTYGLLGGEHFSCWQGRYLRDEFGRHVYEEVPRPHKEGETKLVRVQNPDWNPDRDQIPRADRPDEWTPVGLIGQVLVRVNKSVKAGDKVAPGKAGVATAANEKTGVRVMRITHEYEDAKGYAIAKCMINAQV